MFRDKFLIFARIYVFIIVVGNGAGGVALNYGIKNTLK